MKILMLSHLCPFPANTGAHVRIANIYLGLSQYHEITFVCPSAETCDSPYDIVVIPTSQHTLLRKVRALLSIDPYHQSLYYEPPMMKEVKALLSTEDFDLIYAHCFYTLPYVMGVKNIPILVDQQNVDREYWMRKANSRTASLFLKAFALINTCKVVMLENNMQKHITGYVSVSVKDSQHTGTYAKKDVEYFLVAPNGVDVSHYRQKKYHTISKKLVLGFLGSLDLYLNQSAAERLCNKILPLVRSILPTFEISTLLIGRNPPASIQNLARKDPLVSVTGTVNDVQPYLEEVDILVLPLEEGAGTKLRVLEAMAVGLPVIGSYLALRGIDGIVPGIHALIASNDNSFAIQITELALNPIKMRNMGRAARKLVESSYRWENITRKLSKDIESLVGIHS